MPATAFLLLTIVAAVQPAVFREVQSVNSGEPLGCKDNEAEDIGYSYYHVGESWYPQGECLRKECILHDSSKNQVEIVTYTCGVVGGPQHCLASDLSKPYPECCPKIIKCCI